jgi:CheY-like chemotaxis protein
MTLGRVVMLDDSKTVLVTSRLALREAGYEVFTAETPEELDPGSLDAARLVLIDVNMPQLYGDDLVRILRDDYGVRARIYLYSTITREQGEVRASAAGADGFIEKRNPAALVAEVNRLLKADDAPVGEDDDALRRAMSAQLASSLREHAERVEVLAEARGDVDGRVLRYTVAREIHSASGEAALLGHGLAKDLTQDVVAQLLDPMVLVPEPCWEQLARWFRAVCEHTIELVQGGAPDGPDELEREGTELIRALVPTNMPTFRPKAPPTLEQAQAATGRRLLVIDDSAVVRTLLSSTLSDLGYPVETARDLEEASAKLFEFRPELVITDVSLPGVDGDEICRRIKTSAHRQTPVVFYSGLTEPELSRRARLAGADAFVRKEEGFDALSRCIRQVFLGEVL